MVDLHWVKNGRIINRAQLSMMGFKQENIFEFHDSDLNAIREVDIMLLNRIRAHASAGEFVFIYAYAAGYSHADIYQYLILNSTNP